MKTLQVAEIKRLTAERGTALLLTMPKPDLIDDILYPQLHKFEKNITLFLEGQGFGVTDSFSSAIDGTLAIVTELASAELPEAVLHRGPPVSVAENSASFLDKWKANGDAASEPFIRGGYWHVYVRRKHTRATDSLSESLDNIDAGKDLNSLKPLAKITDRIMDDAIIKQAFSAHLDRRNPWDR
ncbi:MAG: hypothetical protein PHU53_04990, partial [Thermoplasmata archaeon]|nr:hypothetical protein [Thermoplasmata archaeon]